MKKLSKTDLAERDKIASELRDEFEAIERAYEVYNETVRKAHADLSSVVEKYNEAIQSANEWKTGIAAQIQDYMDERSEKWHEGDKASAYESWKEEFEEDFEQIELSEPEELDASDIEQYAEVLEQKTEEVEG